MKFVIGLLKQLVDYSGSPKANFHSKDLTSIEETTSVHQMQIAIKSGLTQIKGNTILFGLAAITLFAGLASEGFDRLWGAYLPLTHYVP